MYDNAMLDLYRKFVVERHRIWEARQNNESQPWTLDSVLRGRKFTNMFRVLDPGSQFVFDLDTPNADDLIARLIMYRITNLPSTWYAMRAHLGRFPLASDMNEDLTKFLREYRGVGNRVFSGAYIILPEPGLRGGDKLVGVVKLVRHFLDGPMQEEFFTATTQAERYAALRRTPGLGDFLSMQILTDWGYLMQDEPDLSFVVAGPGARKGAAHLDPDRKAEEVIYDLTAGWSSHEIVQLGDRSLTMMDVQNTLCEFGKYVRYLSKPGLTTKPYVAAHPGPQPRPTLPQWWAVDPTTGSD